MNPLVKKEIRLLLPAWIAAMMLAVAPGWIIQHFSNYPREVDDNVLPWFVIAGMLFLGIASFGQEFSFNTLSFLLSQPVSRARIWRTKTLLLAAAMASVWLAWGVSRSLHQPMPALGRSGPGVWLPTGLFALAIYSGGLWMVLLFRQVAASFWLAVLTPLALFMVVANLFGNYPDQLVMAIMSVVIVIYGIAGCLFARRLFMRAQDAQWTGGAAVMPEIRGLAQFKIGSSTRRKWRPRMALFFKELQLHQSQFLIAGGLVLLHLGDLATRNLGHFRRNSDVEFILESFWLLWLVMPLLVGCAAAAEERKLGTHEGQLCLPVKRHTQFAVKLCVVLLLSILFGVVMPLIFEGERVLPNAHLDALINLGAQYGEAGPKAMAPTFLWQCIGQINLFLPLLTLGGLVGAIGVVSFYVSSLTRNTLQALGPAVLCIILAWLLLAAAGMQDYAIHPLWRGWLIYFIGVPVVLLALLVLAFRNFRRLATGWILWLRNSLALAMSLTFVIIATTAIYYRAWEQFPFFQPTHGKARLALSNPTMLIVPGTEMSVRLPDGKLWINNFTPSSIYPSPLAIQMGNFNVAVDTGGFIAGSNWTMVKRSWEWVGIKTDGTLWVSEAPRHVGQAQSSDDWKKTKMPCSISCSSALTRTGAACSQPTLQCYW
jgi:hypothetical protein